MANRNRRVNSRSERAHIRNSYEDGNAVRRAAYDPEERQPRRKEQKSVKRKKSERRSGRRKNAGAGFIVVLAIALSLTVFSCINYLQLKSRLTKQSAEIAGMESELSQLKADNDAYYNEVIASVTIEEIKRAALGDLGLHYASESQIRYYDMDDDGYVRQYTEVP